MAFKALLAGVVGACLYSSAASATLVYPLGVLTSGTGVAFGPFTFDTTHFDCT
jgi:hypothetical protein